MSFTQRAVVRSDELISSRSISPESNVQFPPTPSTPDDNSSNVIKAIELIKARRELRCSTEWNVVLLRPNEYNELIRQLEQHDEFWWYFHNKVHSGYDPGNHQFVVQMPTAIHEGLIASMENEINRQLQAFRNGTSSAATLAQHIHSMGSTTINFEDNSHHDPDLQYRHMAAKYPGLVIEVAYSQSSRSGGKDIRRLADKYIVESSGNVKLVVGLMIEYKHSKQSFIPQATISVWGPKFGSDEHGRYLEAEERIVSEEFRSRDGSFCNAERNLRISLRDFIPDVIDVFDDTLQYEIIIPYRSLASWLVQSEKLYQLSEENEGLVDKLQFGTRKRLREESPADQLSVEDERLFKRLEVEDAKKAKRQAEF